MESGPLFILVLAAMAQVPYCGGGAIDHGQALSNNIPFLEEQQSGVFPGKPGNSVQRPFAKSQVDDILFLGSSNTQDLGASVRPNSALVSCHDDERNNREQGEASTYNGAPFMAVLVTGHGGSESATASAMERDNRTLAPPPPALSPAAAHHKPASPIAMEHNNATIRSWSEARQYVVRVMGAPLGTDEKLAILAPIAAYWITSGIYALLAVWCPSYRLHSKSEEKRNLVPKTVVFRTMVLMQIFQAALSTVFFKVTPRGAEASTRPTPALVLAGQFLVGMLVLDTWQYLGHRLMHQNRFLYRHVHSYHHRLVAPYAFAAQYNHPVEALLLDIVSGALAVLVSGMSPATSACFIAFTTVKAVDDHAGMLIPYNPLHVVFRNSTAYHDVHHQLRGSKGNFSQPFFRTWDLALGTHVPFKIVRAANGGLEAVPDKKA